MKNPEWRNERDSSDDSKWALRSAIVNEEFVKRNLKDGDPIGARLGIGSRPDTVTGMEVVGVVKTFQDFGLRKPAPEVFFPLWERSVETGTFYVRSRGSSEYVKTTETQRPREIDRVITRDQYPHFSGFKSSV